jgi:hypothetical protein
MARLLKDVKIKFGVVDHSAADREVLGIGLQDHVLSLNENRKYL